MTTATTAALGALDSLPRFPCLSWLPLTRWTMRADAMLEVADAVNEDKRRMEDLEAIDNWQTAVEDWSVRPLPSALHCPLPTWTSPATYIHMHTQTQIHTYIHIDMYMGGINSHSDVMHGRGQTCATSPIGCCTMAPSPSTPCPRAR